jgi:nicotinamidase/pyrazinamidase
MSISITKDSALLIIDVQNDFCLGGALAVPNSDEVIPLLNQYIQKFLNVPAPIFATRDNHPPNHFSFKENGGPWPAHCVHGTRGVEIHPGLALPYSAQIVNTGFEPNKEGYSGFEGTKLERMLRSLRINRLFIGGLATDYCVKHTVLDGLKIGFEVIFLEDASRGVDVNLGDSEKAIREMIQAGAKKTILLELS